MCAAVTAGSAAEAFAAKHNPTLVRISGLTWGRQSVEEGGEAHEGTEVFADLQGNFEHAGWRLFWQGKPVDISENADSHGEFSLRVLLEKTPTSIELIAKGPQDQVETGRYVIFLSRTAPEGTLDRQQDGDASNIFAETFPVHPSKGPSHSVIFEDPTGARPPVGKILLIKTDQSMLAAVKVVEEIKGQKRFRAFVVKRYDEKRLFDGKKECTAVSKVADIQWAVLSRSAPVRTDFLTPAIGFTSLGYSETGKQSFSELALTTKISYQRLLLGPWSFGFSGYYNAVPLASNQPGTVVRALGVNLRLGYALPFFHDPWSLIFMGGGYYTTMFVTGNAFGYQGLINPHFFPVLRRKLRNGDALIFSLKYTPMASRSSLNLLDTSQREVAAGFGWEHALRNGSALTLSFDASDLLYNPSSTATVELSSLTLSLGYRF